MLSLVSIILFFVATNLDDLLFLITWFSQAKTTEEKWYIVAGQYIGFILLLSISFIGAFGTLQLSEEWVGLFGFIPIYLGMKSLMSLYQSRKKKSRPVMWLFKTAVITFANGADNMGVYIPLFATYNLERIMLILVIFLVLVAIWCYLGLVLVQQPLFARALERYGHFIVPFVLIGLGVFIMVKQGTFHYFL
ncbi:cadmium resistance transporter [Siminovitchia sp. FSL H7-0308]|uniref:cadmium resistance transporter n=1 Tax=Siminovitchia sp. FSL H7-0308 TaxID=2921432 RepID=UPI0030EB5182